MTKDELANTEIKKVGPVAICCITEEAREFLDLIMEKWEAFKPNKNIDHYGFAYWLVRWSGLIDCTNGTIKRRVI